MGAKVAIISKVENYLWGCFLSKILINVNNAIEISSI